MAKYVSCLLLVLSLVFVNASARTFENSSVVGHAEGSMLITVKPGVQMNLDKSGANPTVGLAAVDALASRFSVYGLQPAYAGLTSNLPDKAAVAELDRVWLVEFPVGTDLDAIQAAYAAIPEVEEARLIDLCKLYDATLPNDPGINGTQYYVRNSTVGGADIRAVGAWAETTGDSNIIVAVIDSGVDWHHPDLGGTHPDKVNGSIWTNWTEYYGTPNVDDDGNGYTDDIRGWDFVNVGTGAGWPGEDTSGADNDPMDWGGHGTNCAGTIAGIANNGIGVAGVAYGCKVMALRAAYTPNGTNQGLVNMYYAAAAMLYAANNGANIINCSWGSTSIVAQATAAAQSAGLLVVTAAGNNDTSVNPSYLNTFPGVLSVAATDEDDAKASFSNYGYWVEISAPGQGIYTTTYLASTDQHSYASVDGTSFSSPITCAAAALVWSHHPEYDYNQISIVLTSGCDNIDDQNPAYMGQMGAGRVNLVRSIGDNVQKYPLEYPTVFDAINCASIGDTIAIRAETPVTGPVTFPSKNLKILGGYDYGYTLRDPVASPTVITGNQASSAVRFQGTIDSNTVLDGFRITGGGGLFFNGIPYLARYGGGIFLNGVSPTLRNLEITGNSVGSNSELGCGGGLAMNAASPILENVKIFGNEGIYGSGVFMYDSEPTFIDCDIYDNIPRTDNLTYVAQGGGLHGLDSDVQVDNCTVTGHLNFNDGGGIYMAGHNTSSVLTMTNSEVSGNTAKENGGGIYYSGGDLSLLKVTFDGNTGTPASTFSHGGGIFATGATVSLDSLTCTGNGANVGAAMDLTGNTSADVTNSVIHGNTAVFWGGAIHFDNNTSGTISGNTMAFNAASAGGAGLFLANSSPAVTNNISAFNTGGAGYGNGMALNSVPSALSCNDVFGNDNSQYTGQPDPTGTDGNVSLDPQFCDAPGGNFQVSAGSPCAAAQSGSCGLIGALTSGCASAVDDELPGAAPVSFRVQQNYPNPFNPRTTIKFDLPAAGRTKVSIFDVAGRRVRTLVDEDLPASSHQVVWTGDDDRGQKVSAGIYFYLVTSGSQRAVGRMALVK